ncbi:uncharacterized protein TA05635 [Theileria annulata]|uniref:Uncharacterized protein n=1 Tax=Theileria annulata TaxID=5874 RepID=Q4UHN3_THEAN|nr:uncharacterized protein TA05635 [Theileria annulata]CAI73406.1 hypothetical protein TA05635 [Theileria annulata]|eukprot:XP_954083.1 hypothetical protein TA05635 [Theileria annulata]
MKYPNERDHLLPINSNDNFKYENELITQYHKSHELNTQYHRSHELNTQYNYDNNLKDKFNETKYNKFRDDLKDEISFQSFDLRDEKLEDMDINNKFNQFCFKLFHSDLSPKTYLFLFLSNILILFDNIFFDTTILICALLELFVTIFFTLEVYINFILHVSFT